MKKLNSLMFVFLGVLLFANHTNAQCVQCAPSQLVPNTLSCQSSSSGGKECAPNPNGQACLIAGVCTGGGIGGEGGGSRSAQSAGDCFKEKIGEVEFDKKIINELGTRHPRLALALAWVNQSGFLGTKDVKIYLSPIEINNDIYNKWLNNILAESQTNALSLFGKNTPEREQLPSPPKGAEIVIYSVDVITQENPNNKIIRFTPIKTSASDLTFTSLDLFLEEISGGAGAKTEKRWKVSNWELN